MRKILDRMEKSDEVRRNVLHLRAKAIDMLTDEVTMHKGNTKILENMGQSLSAEEAADLRNKLESLEHAQTKVESTIADLQAAKHKAESDLTWSNDSHKGLKKSYEDLTGRLAREKERVL